MEIPQTILDLAERLRTQDGRATADPYFCIQEKHREYGYDPQWCDNPVWILDGEEVPEGTEDADETGYKDEWRTVQVALTEIAADQYIQANRHRLNEPRTYVDSFYRCHEMIGLRKWLMTLGADDGCVASTGARLGASGRGTS